MPAKKKTAAKKAAKRAKKAVPVPVPVPVPSADPPPLDSLEQQLQCVGAFVIERLGIDEIATRFGMSHRTVLKALSSARQLRDGEMAALRQCALETLYMVTIRDLPEVRKRALAEPIERTKMDEAGNSVTEMVCPPDQKHMVALYATLMKNLGAVAAGDAGVPVAPGKQENESFRDIVLGSPAMREHLRAMLMEAPETRILKKGKR